MKESYTLRPNRYNERRKFIRQGEENLYLLDEAEHLRVGYEHDGSVNFIDPPGGPFICKDCVLYCDEAILVVTGFKCTDNGVFVTLSEYAEEKK